MVLGTGRRDQRVDRGHGGLRGAATEEARRRPPPPPREASLKPRFFVAASGRAS
jgi:hypothetical protein